MHTNMNPDSEPWNIALVDNDALVRSYLETYLGGLPEFNICWSMQSGRDAVEAYHHSIACTNCVPDLIVTDLSMHGMSGFELCATIRFEDDHTPILGCSSYMIEPYERDAVNNGMQGLLLKNELAQLANGMRTLLSGQPLLKSNGLPYETPQQAHERLLMQGKPAIMSMSPNEQAVMELCSEGLSTRTIAEETGDSESTVKTYISRAMRKLRAKSRAEAVASWSRKTKL